MNNATIILRWLALAILFASAAVTYLLMNNMEQFYVVDQQVLEDPDFIEIHKYWKQKRKNSPVVSYEGDVLHIAHDQRTSNQVSQVVSVQAPGYVRLSVDLGGIGIIAEDIYSAGGVATVVFYNIDGLRLGHSNVAMLKRGTPLRPYSKIVFLDKHVAKVGVAFRLLRSEGRLTARNPELSVMGELPAFKRVNNALVVYWTVVGAVLFFWGFKSLSTKLLWWLGGISILAIVGILMPGGFVTSVNIWLFSLLPEGGAVGLQNMMAFFFGTGATAGPFASLSKLAHFLVFMLIGVLIGQAFRQIGLFYGFALITVFALVTESLQTLVYGRSTSLRDVYIDISGGLFGLVVGVGCVLLLEKIRFAAEPV